LADIPLIAWPVLGALVVALFAVDLLVFARRRAPTLRESLLWSLAWLAIALVFGAGWWLWQGGDAGSQYFAGYLLERSLSLDNVFVFAVILSYFAVPPAAQSHVLGWGIVLALALRLVFILVGAALLDAFHATFYVFGVLLLYTAYRLARHAGSQAEPEPSGLLQRLRLPAASAAFVAVAVTDVIFAVDSIPAIFAVTRDSFIVFAANAFAMLGLRALYFLLAGMRERFVYLSHGLAAILGFIGVKMLLVDVWHVPIWLSLSVIVATLGVATLASVRASDRSVAT
jgi:predicted tellurium resistance membrane protein TerC